ADAVVVAGGRGRAGDDRVQEPAGRDEERRHGQRRRVEHAVGGRRAVGVGADPGGVGQGERQQRLDGGRVAGGGPGRTARTLRVTDGGHVGDVELAVEDAAGRAVLGDEVVRAGIDLVA